MAREPSFTEVLSRWNFFQPGYEDHIREWLDDRRAAEKTWKTVCERARPSFPINAREFIRFVLDLRRYAEGPKTQERFDLAENGRFAVHKKKIRRLVKDTDFPLQLAAELEAAASELRAEFLVISSRLSPPNIEARQPSPPLRPGFSIVINNREQQLSRKKITLSRNIFMWGLADYLDSHCRGRQLNAVIASLTEIAFPQQSVTTEMVRMALRRRRKGGRAKKE